MKVGKYQHYRSVICTPFYIWMVIDEMTSRCVMENESVMFQESNDFARPNGGDTLRIQHHEASRRGTRRFGLPHRASSGARVWGSCRPPASSWLQSPACL